MFGVNGEVDEVISFVIGVGESQADRLGGIVEDLGNRREPRVEDLTGGVRRFSHRIGVRREKLGEDWGVKIHWTIPRPELPAPGNGT